MITRDIIEQVLGGAQWETGIRFEHKDGCPTIRASWCVPRGEYVMVDETGEGKMLWSHGKLDDLCPPDAA